MRMGRIAFSKCLVAFSWGLGNESEGGGGLSQDQIGEEDQSGEECGASEGTRFEGGASERGLEAVHGQSAGSFWWWTDGSILSRVFHVGCLGDKVGFSILDLGEKLIFSGLFFRSSSLGPTRRAWSSVR